MELKIIIAGSGGQGILFLGRTLAAAGMTEGRAVTWFPSYGAEMRGGTANCTVVISDDMIGSPVTMNPDILVAMNSASVDRFLPNLKKGGTMIYDSSLIHNITGQRGKKLIPVPATETAGSTGSIKSANMVMAGALVAATRIIDKKTIFRLLEGGSKASASAANIELVRRGMELIENTQGPHKRH